MKTRIVRGTEIVGEFDLEYGEYLIGSAEEAHLRLPGHSVAPRHARLKIGASGVEVEDLGSGLGTILGELAVAGVQPVPNGAVIHIGGLALQVWDDVLDGALAVEAAIESENAAPDADGSSAGRYVVGEIVAQGAMGVIRRAHEIGTGREVAMKQMHGRLETGDAALAARFVQEAKITAHLEHPNVVPVHDVASGADGSRFYTMKMVRGISLEQILHLLGQGGAGTEKKYLLESLLTIFQKVCDALAFAHSKGVIHRDLKPANIMVGEYGEVLVMDWGVAKVLFEMEEILPSSLGAAVADSRAAFATMAGTVMGTPYYMAPEQASGEVTFVDERSDIYALGAILYELLTLKTPVEGNSAKEVLKNVRDGKIVPPLQRAGDKPLAHLPGGKIPASLAAVAMKAMAFSPERRYQSVPELQSEVRAFQSGRATGAEDASAWRQFTLLIQRNKGVSTALAASLVLLAILSAIYTAGVIRERNRANGERDRANIEKDRTTEALAQVEPERQRANSERDRATAALAKIEPERQRANAERDRATEALAQANVEKQRAETALGRLKQTAPAFMALAHELADEAKTDEALQKIGFALTLDPKNASYLRYKADILETSQRLSEAAEAYRGVLALGEDPLARKNLDICERLLRENGASPTLTTVVREKLQGALAEQGRTNDDRIISRNTADAMEQLRVKTLGVARARAGQKRVKALADGTFNLDLSGADLKSLPDLGSLPVSILDISDNPSLTDITPLRGIKLKELKMLNLNVSDLSPLTGMRLETLLLECERVRDFSPLRGMPLKRLFLVGARFSDFTVPAQFPSLEMLNLKRSNFKDLSLLRDLKLKSLDLSETAVTDLSPLIGMPLTDLIIDPSVVTKLEPLGVLQLKHLAFSNSWGGHIVPVPSTALISLMRCRSLETLVFVAPASVGPGTQSLCRALAGLPNLKHIDFARVELFDWTDGTGLPPIVTFDKAGSAAQFFSTL